MSAAASRHRPRPAPGRRPVVVLGAAVAAAVLLAGCDDAEAPAAGPSSAAGGAIADIPDLCAAVRAATPPDLGVVGGEERTVADAADRRTVACDLTGADGVRVEVLVTSLRATPTAATSTRDAEVDAACASLRESAVRDYEEDGRGCTARADADPASGVTLTRVFGIGGSAAVATATLTAPRTAAQVGAALAFVAGDLYPDGLSRG